LNGEKLLFAIPDDQLTKVPPAEDEFECLNLRITMPKERGDKPLPVYVNVPGGANMRASNGVRLFGSCFP
jgi:hypothetical protein